MGGQPQQNADQVIRIVVSEDALLGTAVTYAGDHRCVIVGIRQNDHAGDRRAGVDSAASLATKPDVNTSAASRLCRSETSASSCKCR